MLRATVRTNSLLTRFRLQDQSSETQPPTGRWKQRTGGTDDAVRRGGKTPCVLGSSLAQAPQLGAAVLGRAGTTSTTAQGTRPVLPPVFCVP